jgi:hypothetical protein
MPQRACRARTAEQFRCAADEAEALAALQPVQGWDVFAGSLMLAPELRADLAGLQAALPGYELTVTRRACAYRFEAVRRPDGPGNGPWCVISTDAADLWRELAAWTRPGQSTRAP